MLSLENRGAQSKSAPGSRAERLREDITRQSAMADPLITYTPRTPPPEYDAAYDVVYNKKTHGGRVEQYFLRHGEDGNVTEFVECHPNMPSPSCSFEVSLPRQPALSISYVHSMELWDSRREVRNAILSVVESFYDAAIYR
jgi:hypothetical protein